MIDDAGDGFSERLRNDLLALLRASLCDGRVGDALALGEILRQGGFGPGPTEPDPGVATGGVTPVSRRPGDESTVTLCDAAPEALTLAERRICAAIGRGLSNKAIATELYLSRRTVETHVSRVLRKLGVSSRLQVALRFGATSPTALELVA